MLDVARKQIGSTIAMERSVRTSELLHYRSTVCVPRRIAAVRRALHDGDWPALAKEVVRDSNQMHAVCVDTSPPIHVRRFDRFITSWQYLNENSWRVIDLVEAYNAEHGTAIAYTFDAGPNACLFMLQVVMFHQR